MSTIPHGFIRVALRQVWYYRSAERKAVLARVKVKGQKKGGVCEWCRAVVPKIEVDHIIPCGPTPGSRNAVEGLTWDDFISRLFIDRGGLQGLCVPCHKLKTSEDREQL